VDTVDGEHAGATPEGTKQEEARDNQHAQVGEAPEGLPPDHPLQVMIQVVDDGGAEPAPLVDGQERVEGRCHEYRCQQMAESQNGPEVFHGPVLLPAQRA